MYMRTYVNYEIYVFRNFHLCLYCFVFINVRIYTCIYIYIYIYIICRFHVYICVYGHRYRRRCRHKTIGIDIGIDINIDMYIDADANTRKGLQMQNTDEQLGESIGIYPCMYAYGCAYLQKTYGYMHIDRDREANLGACVIVEVDAFIMSVHT